MLDKVLTLLAAVAELLRRWRRLREQAQHEQQADEIQASPAQWMDEHFNGPGDGHNADRLHQPSEVPGASADACEAKTTEPGAKP